VIILDTDVVSALMRAEPDAAVVGWLDRQPAESIWTTAITAFEVRFGIALLATGRRRQQLEAAFDRALAEDFQGRVLPFDQDAALEAAAVAAERQRVGRPVDLRDTQIAGIAVARRATVATRNLRHFQGLAVAVVNPWAR
jgi:predicted nucleic acid-binding protein